MPAQIFGRRMKNDVRSPLERIYEWGWSECGIHYDLRSGRVSLEDAVTNNSDSS